MFQQVDDVLLLAKVAAEEHEILTAGGKTKRCRKNKVFKFPETRTEKSKGEFCWRHADLFRKDKGRQQEEYLDWEHKKFQFLPPSVSNMGSVIITNPKENHISASE